MDFRFHRSAAGLGAALLPLLGVAGAADAAPPPPGRLLASNCFQCHGTNGAGPGFERLAGKPANEIYEEMKEMQSGQEGESIMSKHARGYTDAQLRLLSTWLSQQPRSTVSGSRGR